jgi:serine protease Do
MSRRFALVAITLTGVVAFLTGFTVAGTVRSASNATSAPVRSAEAPARRPAERGLPVAGDFTEIAARLNPAVVSVDATSRGPDARVPPGHLGGAPGDDGLRRRGTPRRGVGSGFVIDADGYILTNDHVVDQADRLTVKLFDGRSLRARVIGTDPDTDVALIKVDGADRLTVAPLGDSSTLRVGDWVCAIGDPLGYEHTLTVGVISFLGRKLFDQSLDDYIQTDAAINFGNSGGPLLNARGEVVGINAAISSRASNIGFAVPINIAAVGLPQLKARGRVVRGYMGVTLQDVDPELQQSLGLGADAGALVVDVAPGSPALRAGLEPYDLIVGVDGRPIGSDDELIRDVSALQPGSSVRLHLLRGGQVRDLTVRLTERPGQGPSEAPGTSRGPARPDSTPSIGLAVRALDPDVARRLKLPRSLRGVVVAGVEPLSPAYDADIERGDVILEINRQPVTSPAEYRRVTTAARPGQVLAFFLLMPGGQHALRTVRVEGTP